MEEEDYMMVGDEKFDKDFQGYLSSVENSKSLPTGGWSGVNQKWSKHSSPEGGSATIAYGHKLTENETKTNTIYGVDVSKGISDEDAMFIQQKDLVIHKQRARKIVDKMYENGTFDTMDIDSQDMLTEFSYNGVLKKFPKFTKAVVNRDEEGIKTEYERSYKDTDGTSQPLRRRNKAFYDYFLKGV